MKNKIMALGLAFSALCSLNAAVVTFEDVDLGSNKYMEPAVQDQDATYDWSSGNVAYFPTTILGGGLTLHGRGSRFQKTPILPQKTTQTSIAQ